MLQNVAFAGQWRISSKKGHNVTWCAKHTMGTDLFVPMVYCLTVDIFPSNFSENDYLAGTMSTTVVKRLKAHVACQGIPNTAKSALSNRMLFSPFWTTVTHHHSDRSPIQPIRFSVTIPKQYYQWKQAYSSYGLCRSNMISKATNNVRKPSMTGQLKTWTCLPQVTVWECSLWHPTLSWQ